MGHTKAQISISKSETHWERGEACGIRGAHWESGAHIYIGKSRAN